MKEIKISTTFKTQWVVTENMLACNVGSGEAEVFSTPMLCALMENAAMHALDEFLEGDETTVGTFMELSHTAATPHGMKVWAKAEITAVNGREITYSITAYDSCGEIGKATHKRFVVLKEKFSLKAKAKLEAN